MDKNSNIKRYIQFAIVVLAAGSIYPLVYLRSAYQETIIEVFKMDGATLNGIYTALGFAFILGYFPSGWLSDKVSAKKLIVFSLAVTGAAGIWFAQIPSVTMVYVIFVIWGFSTVLTFWSAHLKIVKMLATKDEQGRFFGILDGGRGAIEAVLATIGLTIFTSLSAGGVEKEAGLVGVIYMYSILLIVLAVVVQFLLNDKQEHTEELTEEEKKVSTEELPFGKAMTIIFKNPAVWTLGFIIMGSYVVTWTYYYFGGFLQTNIGVDATTVATVMVIAMWMRPIGGTLAGFLGDKIGRTKILVSTLLIGFGGLLAMSILPTTSGTTIFFGLVIFTSLIIYMIRGVYWSLLDDCKVDNRVLGKTIGVVSILGYLPDVLLPIINIYLFNVFGNEGGYNAYFIFSGIFGVIAVVLISVFRKVNVART
ncbi:MAG: MFS transporter [Mycoplasmatales bacterium]